MRRDALNQLTALRGRQEDVKLGKPAKPAMYSGERSQPVYTVQVTTREQITAKLLKMKPAVLYVPLHILAADLQFTQELARRVKVCAVLPRIIHDGEVSGLQQSLRLVKASGVREVLVGNLGHLVPVRECGMAIRGDFGLNLFNSIAVNMAKQMELRSACLSFEMTLPQMRDVSKAVPCEIFAYGRLPLMVTENCLIRGRTGSCTCNLGNTKLVDKTGAEFPVIKDGDKCRSILLNGKKLNWLDRQDDLAKLGLWAVRLYFTTENAKEVDNVLSAYLNPPAFDPGACTRGLYLRGLE
jgi:putative protease